MKGSAGSTLGIENGICIEIKNRVWEERRPFMAYIEFNNVTKEYKTGETSIKALDGASFSVEKGELAVILGSSGAGKTTALNILGGMDVPTAGEIKVDGRDIAKYNKKQLVGYRRTDIGFVFQFYNLVPNLTAIENVELAAQVCRNSLDAGEMLTKVGLADRKITFRRSFPEENSSGCLSRVRSPRIRNSCSAMSRRERLTITPENRFCSCCRIPAGTMGLRYF